MIRYLAALFLLFVSLGAMACPTPVESYPTITAASCYIGAIRQNVPNVYAYLAARGAAAPGPGWSFQTNLSCAASQGAPADALVTVYTLSCTGGPCPSGQSWDIASSSCKVPPPPCGKDSLQMGWSGVASSLPDYGDTACYNGCTYSTPPVLFFDPVGFGGFGGWSGTFTGTGAACSGSDPGLGPKTPSPPPPTCPEGSLQGNVNGVAGCYKTTTSVTTQVVPPNPNEYGGVTIKTTTVTNVVNVNTNSVVSTSSSSNVVAKDADGNVVSTSGSSSDSSGGSSSSSSSSGGDGSGSSSSTSAGVGSGSSSSTSAGSGGAGKPAVGSGAGGAPTPTDVDCTANPAQSKCAGSGGVFGGPPAPTYTPKDATFGNAISTFKDQVSGSGLGLAAVAFFNVQASGACPTWTAQVPYLNYTIVFDQFCQDWATSLYPLIGAAMLVVFGWVAFTIAIL